MGIARGRDKERWGRERERGEEGWKGEREKGEGRIEKGEGRGLMRGVSRAKMLLSDTLGFHKSKELSAKRADTDSFPRARMVSYGISFL